MCLQVGALGSKDVLEEGGCFAAECGAGVSGDVEVAQVV